MVFIAARGQQFIGAVDIVFGDCQSVEEKPLIPNNVAYRKFLK